MWLQKHPFKQALRGGERLRVINTPSPPFQEVPELHMIAKRESAFDSLPEASALADIREGILETTTGSWAALNQGVSSCTDHQHLHSGHCCTFFSVLLCI